MGAGWNCVDDAGTVIGNAVTAMENVGRRTRLYYPHPRTRSLQRYCSEPQCRAASKKASQRRWLQKPENRMGVFGEPAVRHPRGCIRRTEFHEIGSVDFSTLDLAILRIDTSNSAGQRPPRSLSSRQPGPGATGCYRRCPRAFVPPARGPRALQSRPRQPDVGVTGRRCWASGIGVCVTTHIISPAHRLV
jgi:hypothetical protein